MLKEAVLKLLRARNANPGESVEFSWFVFRVCEGSNGLDVETLDFQDMASFTRDFSAVERIHAQQTEVLEQQGVEPLGCTLRHYAHVHPDFTPGTPEALLYRKSGAVRDDSGWFVGVRNRPLPVNDRRQFNAMSLYEIGLDDDRFLPFWLLPQGWSVVFENGAPLVVPPGESARYFEIDQTPGNPWWKFW